MPGNTESDLKSVRPVIRGASEKAPASFAFGMASKAADSFMVVDKSKAPKSLEGEAKKGAGNGAKVISGKVFCEGTDAIFITEDASPTVSRGIGDWLKLHKLGLSPDVSKPEPPGEEEDDEGPKMYQTETLLQRFRFAMRNPVNFAFGPGKEKGDALLALHARRSGKAMFRGIKRQNHAIRGNWGVLNLEGRIATFTCDEKPIPGLRKQIRAFLRGRDLRYRVIIMGPEGEVIEPGDEEDDAADQQADQQQGNQQAEQQQQGNQQTEQPPEPQTEADGDQQNARRLEEMRTTLQRMLDPLKEIAEKVPARRNDIRSLHQAFTKAAGESNVAEAQNALDALREQGRTGRADIQALATMRQRLDAQLPTLQQMFQQRSAEDAALIRETYRRCDTAIKAGEVAAAREVMFELAALMRAPVNPAEGGAQQGTVDFRQLLLRWNRAQTDVAANVAALGEAVLNHPEVKADPRFAEVQQAVRELPEVVPDFGSSLQDALDAIIGAGAEAKARDLIAPAIRAVDAYTAELAKYPAMTELEELAREAGVSNLAFGRALGQALAELGSTLRAAA